jgi:hypothetical protein
MRAGIDLCGSRADEIGKPRIRNLDRRMQRVDRIEHLSHGVRRQSRRQIRVHAEGEFGLGDAHFISGHRSRAAVPMTVSARMRPAIGPSTLICFCPASLVAAIFQPNRLPLE